jgi:hypothetical protein
METFVTTLELVTGMRQNQDFYAALNGTWTIAGHGKVVNVALVKGKYQVSILDGGKYMIVATEAAQKGAAWAVRALIK